MKEYNGKVRVVFKNMVVHPQVVTGAHLAGCAPLLIMDVFEHAFITDYGLKRADYIEAFFANLNWQAAESRLK